MGLRSWRERRGRERAARRIVADLFRNPALLRDTSLEPRHAARWVLLGFELEGEDVARVRFGILRHPRPYAFSRQSHKVIEEYLFEVWARRLVRVGGHNVTRERGRDADD